MIYTLSGGDAGGLTVDLPSKTSTFCVTIDEVVDADGAVTLVARVTPKGYSYDTSRSVDTGDATYTGFTS